MGEYAEMTLEGVYCQGCGQLMIGPGEKPQGFSGYCSEDCAKPSLHDSIRQDRIEDYVDAQPAQPSTSDGAS